MPICEGDSVTICILLTNEGTACGYVEFAVGSCVWLFWFWLLSLRQKAKGASAISVWYCLNGVSLFCC